MLIELLLTTVVVGFVGALLYIIQLQKELLVQPICSEEKEVPQTQSAAPIEVKTQSASGLNFPTSYLSPQIQSSRSEEEEKCPIPTKASITDGKLHETLQHTQNKWKKKFSTISSKVTSIINLKTETEIEYQDPSMLTRALKENLKKNSNIYKSLDAVTIYKLNLNKISSNKTSQIKKFEFGISASGSYVKNEKVIMILGATGSGKTTLINSLINYVFGVEYKMDFGLNW